MLSASDDTCLRSHGCGGLRVAVSIILPDDSARKMPSAVNKYFDGKASPCLQKAWQGNPYWTRVHLDSNNPKLKNYLTLAGKGRHIELGAFLSPGERIELRDKIQNALAKANSA